MFGFVALRVKVLISVCANRASETKKQLFWFFFFVLFFRKLYVNAWVAK